MSASTATSLSVPSSVNGPERKARRRSAALGVVAWVVGIGFCPRPCGWC
ncbi:mannitol ABC transporter permease [Streptomyces badius]